MRASVWPEIPRSCLPSNGRGNDDTERPRSGDRPLHGAETWGRMTARGRRSEARAAWGPIKGRGMGVTGPSTLSTAGRRVGFPVHVCRLEGRAARQGTGGSMRPRRLSSANVSSSTAEECHRARPLSTWTSFWEVSAAGRRSGLAVEQLGPTAVLVCVLVADLAGHATRLSQVASLKSRNSCRVRSMVTSMNAISITLSSSRPE
jgi:hypothetical protein